MSSYNHRKRTSLILTILSPCIFILAVLSSAIPSFGLYISLVLVVLGGFAMLTAGILRESTARRDHTIQQISDSEIEDILV
jgi:hypothetical protein